MKETLLYQKIFASSVELTRYYEKNPDDKQLLELVGIFLRPRITHFRAEVLECLRRLKCTNISVPAFGNIKELVELIKIVEYESNPEAQISILKETLKKYSSLEIVLFMALFFPDGYKARRRRVYDFFKKQKPEITPGLNLYPSTLTANNIFRNAYTDSRIEKTFLLLAEEKPKKSTERILGVKLRGKKAIPFSHNRGAVLHSASAEEVAKSFLPVSKELHNFFGEEVVIFCKVTSGRPAKVTILSIVNPNSVTTGFGNIFVATDIFFSRHSKLLESRGLFFAKWQNATLQTVKEKLLQARKTIPAGELSLIVAQTQRVRSTLDYLFLYDRISIETSEVIEVEGIDVMGNYSPEVYFKEPATGNFVSSSYSSKEEIKFLRNCPFIKDLKLKAIKFYNPSIWFLKDIK